MDYRAIIKEENDDEPRLLAVVAPRLSFTGGKSNSLQLSVEQDGQDAYIDLNLSEVKLLISALQEWVDEI